MKYAVNGRCEGCLLREGTPVKICIEIKGESLRVESVSEGRCTVCGDAVLNMKTEQKPVTSPPVSPPVPPQPQAGPVSVSVPVQTKEVVSASAAPSQVTPQPAKTMPAQKQPKKRGFFSFFKGKKEETPAHAPPSGERRTEAQPVHPAPPPAEAPPPAKTEGVPAPAHPQPVTPAPAPPAPKPEAPPATRPRPAQEQKKEEDILPPVLPF